MASLLQEEADEVLAAQTKTSARRAKKAKKKKGAPTSPVAMPPLSPGASSVQSQDSTPPAALPASHDSQAHTIVAGISALDISSACPPEEGTPAVVAASSAEVVVADEPPEELVCPLTHELMVDPVMTEHGQTYERAALERWLAQHSTDPLTGVQLSDTALRPNVLVRSLCNKYANKP